MTALPLALLLAAGTRAADKLEPADAGTVAAVEKFLSLAIEDVPPQAIEPILAIRPESLPGKLRPRFKARRVQLYTLQRLAETGKKGNFISSNDECNMVKEAKSNELDVLRLAGYYEITSDDVSCIMAKTKCSEQDLMCHFTLQVVKQKKKFRYFLHEKDPIGTILAVCRATQKVGGQTNFFGTGSPTCSERR